MTSDTNRVEGLEPVRVQLKRTKGWKMPENTVKVDRTTRWGNDFIVWESGSRWACEYVETDATVTRLAEFDTREEAAADAVTRFRAEATRRPPGDFARLRGKNLACWRKPGSPCHADVLLDLANPARGET